MAILRGGTKLTGANESLSHILCSHRIFFSIHQGMSTYVIFGAFSPSSSVFPSEYKHSRASLHAVTLHYLF